MCSVCARAARAAFLDAQGGAVTTHFAEALYDQAQPVLLTGTYKLTADKLTSAMPVDGVGDLKPAPTPFALIAITPDEAGDGIGKAPGNPVLVLGAPHTYGTINTNGDQDYYQVTFEAGKTYQIGMYGYTAPVGSTDRAGVPLADAFIEVRDASGNLITTADGGANTPANTVNSGFDVLLTFTPETSGTYYINARAFDNDSTDGTTGEGVGDYEVFAKEVAANDPSVYRPYYEVDSPLYALDWGTQVNKVNQSVRNPDGSEGTRETGNAQGTPTYGAGFTYDPDGAGPQGVQTFDNIAGLAAAQGKDITGKNVITIYFAKEGDVFASNDPTQPGLPPATITAVAIKDYEFKAVFTALAEFEKVADVVYLQVDDRNQADFVYTSYTGTPGRGTPSLLGSMSPPDESDEGLAQFNSNDHRWNARDLAQGGFSFVTLIHEFGHGHGLAHPHDNGGRSGVMRGVVEEGTAFDYTTGDFDLNQGVFTMMSYEDGWQKSPYGNARTDVGYGYLGGLMAFDIAAIQDKYGVNENWATGNDTYVLKDENAPGTFYSSIWDGGGTDEIVYNGAKDANIDLRAATLKYEAGGGGNVSYAFGIFGGFTVANGVTIENAKSGSGNDKLFGNAANNILDGGAGNDLLNFAAGGDDTGIGGDGGDAFYFGGALTALDVVDGGAGADILALQGNYPALTLAAAHLTNVETLSLVSGLDARFGDTAGNLYSYLVTSVDANVAAGAKLIVNGAALKAGENLTFNGAAETDGYFFIYGGAGVDTLTGGRGADIFFLAEGRLNAGDSFNGGAGADILTLRGDYSGSNAVVFGATQLVDVETVSLLSASDTRFFGGGTTYSYNVTTNDANLAAGASMTINGARLTATETMVFNGSAETNGTFRLFAGDGSDRLVGGAGNDLLHGGLGADELTGGAGADQFRFQAVADSGPAAMDKILDFAGGADKIDLSRIDANTANGSGNDAFTFIGSDAFTGAGQLRAVFDPASNSWTVSGDVDGDGAADFAVQVFTVNQEPLVATDFML